MDLLEQVSAQFEQCDSCGAPVDRAQRYCVVCGAHRRHVRDPASRYLGAVTRRSSTAAPAGAGSGARRRARSPGLGLALALAVIPLAVGLGVLVGRSSTSGDNKLIAALRAQKPEVIMSAPATSAGGTATATAPAATARAVTALTSNFPLQSGYSVELQTLPPKTSASDVTRAEHSAASKGASHTGLILLHDFRVTPAPPAGDYVIYSGAYKAKAAAGQALTKLSKQFPSASVIHVQAAGTSAEPSGKVLAKTQYGSAHQVSGFTPSRSQLSAGAKVVQKIQKTAGKSYVNSQRGLPDQISVP